MNLQSAIQAEFGGRIRGEGKKPTEKNNKPRWWFQIFFIFVSLAIPTFDLGQFWNIIP